MRVLQIATAAHKRPARLFLQSMPGDGATPNPQRLGQYARATMTLQCRADPSGKPVSREPSGNCDAAPGRGITTRRDLRPVFPCEYAILAI
jgi:hypothetical protein